MVSSARDRVDSFAGVDLTVPARSAAHHSEDDDLVEAARLGDRGAFGRLYERYAGMVHGLLLAKVPFADVDDLVQDTFVKALRSLSALRENGSFGPWLAAIARNLANDHYRRVAPAAALDEDLVEELASALPAVEWSAGGVLEAIRKLPDAYRETLILRLVEGMTGPEIAARTGLTPGSVRVNLHRGMQQLRTSLNLTPQSDRCNKGTT